MKEYLNNLNHFQNNQLYMNKCNYQQYLHMLLEHDNYLFLHIHQYLFFF